MVRHGAKGETRRHQEAEGSMSSNVEVTGAARPLCAASVLTAGLCPGDDKGE